MLKVAGIEVGDIRRMSGMVISLRCLLIWIALLVFLPAHHTSNIPFRRSAWSLYLASFQYFASFEFLNSASKYTIYPPRDYFPLPTIVVSLTDICFLHIPPCCRLRQCLPHKCSPVLSASVPSTEIPLGILILLRITRCSLNQLRCTTLAREPARCSTQSKLRTNS